MVFIARFSGTDIITLLSAFFVPFPIAISHSNASLTSLCEIKSSEIDFKASITSISACNESSEFISYVSLGNSPMFQRSGNSL